jgi:hypothetical protein
MSKRKSRAGDTAAHDLVQLLEKEPTEGDALELSRMLDAEPLLVKHVRKGRAVLRERSALNREEARAADEKDLPRVVELFRRGGVVKTVMADTGFSKERVTRLRKLARSRGQLP